MLQRALQYMSQGGRAPAAQVCVALAVAGVLAGATSLAWQGDPAVRAQGVPTFKTGVALVPITAVAMDSGGRLVRDLTRDDFEVLENGKPRSIVDFRATDAAPVSLAVLVDTSGSMRDGHLERGKQVVNQLLARLNHAEDEVALFTFDKGLREETPFTSDHEAVRKAMGKMVAWGLTALYDAIGETSRRLADRRTQRRAVIVVTDGTDTSSTLKPEDVSQLASEMDVPVYLFTVARQRRRLFGSDDTLSDLSQLTGGMHVRAHTSDEFDATLTAFLAEMRQLYFLAVESSPAAGWHRLDVKTKRRGVTVRARRGYVTKP